MTTRRPLGIWTALVLFLIALSTLSTFYIQYRVALGREKAHLEKLALALSNLVQAVGEYDRQAYIRNTGEDRPRVALDLTLGQVRQAMQAMRAQDPGLTLVLAENGPEGGRGLIHSAGALAEDIEEAGAVADDGGALRLALAGEAGVMTERDSRGREFFTAYRPVRVGHFTLGLAVRQSLAEFRRPFVFGGLFASGAAVVLAIGAALLMRLSGRETEETLRLSLAEARESELRFRGTFEQAAVGIAHIDPDGRWLRVNERICRITEYPREELIGRPFQDITCPEDRPASLRHFDSLVREERDGYVLDQQYRTRSGERVFVKVTASLQRDAEDRPLYIIAVVEDVSMSKRMEARLVESRQALVASEKRLIDAQRLAGMGDFVWRPPTGEVTWSRALFELLGYDADAALDIETIHNAVHHPDDLPRIRSWFDQAFAAGETRIGPKEYRLLRRDGGIVTARIFARIDYEGGSATRVAGTVQDISREEAMRERARRLDRLELLGAISSGVAHELSNALTPVKLALEAVRDLSVPADFKRLLQSAESGMARSARIAERLLESTKREGDSHEQSAPGLVSVQVADVARESFPRNIHVVHRAEPELPLIPVAPPLLEQVLLNLALNARDAMPGGGVLEMRVERQNLRSGSSLLEQVNADPGAYVVFSVRDTGEGIPEALVDRVFEPFVSTKKDLPVTGLGLSTVRGITESAGGFVDLRSDPGSGTTASVFFPVAAEARSPGSPSPGEAPDADAPSAPVAPPGRVLLVDDDEQIRMAVAAALEASDMRVDTAENGRRALDLLEDGGEAYALAICDIDMPVMDGRSFFQACSSSFPELPFIFISGHGYSREDDRLPIPREKILRKPFTVAQLMDRVHRIFSPS